MSYQKRNFRGALTNGKLIGVSVMNIKTILKKSNVSFAVPFYLGIYSFCLNTFEHTLHNTTYIP